MLHLGILKLTLQYYRDERSNRCPVGMVYRLRDNVSLTTMEDVGVKIHAPYFTKRDSQ